MNVSSPVLAYPPSCLATLWLLVPVIEVPTNLLTLVILLVHLRNLIPPTGVDVIRCLIIVLRSNLYMIP